jgi:DNA-binding protein YbaB
VDSNQVVAAYQQEVAEIAGRAEEAKERIKSLTGTATSRDGAVTVTVSGAGALLDVSFGAAADRVPRAQLAAAIMAAARQAQAQASQQILAIMEPLVGADSDAMRFVREQIPSPDVEPEEEPEQSYPGAPEFDDEPSSPPPRPEPRPARGRSSDGDEEDDFGQGSPLNRTESW